MFLTTAVIPSEGGGFNPLDFTQLGVMLWTLIIFGAALFPIWKVVMGPVTRALVDRDKKAETAIASAEQARRETEAARAEVEARLVEARAEAARTMEAARTRAEVRERELTEEAKKASELLLERARSEIRSEQDKAIAQIRAQVVDISLAAAGKVLERRVDSADDRRLVESLVGSSAAPAKPGSGGRA
ncbi:MAG TPA: F0F1 ATP synthase subunit B [Planctomycetota bacterium]|jgi:F-type H+-transporting ATPase subunit b|nr:F0F1 ATP synthase subunit B [Planctomycetota bacterium]